MTVKKIYRGAFFGHKTLCMKIIVRNNFLISRNPPEIEKKMFTKMSNKTFSISNIFMEVDFK